MNRLFSFVLPALALAAAACNPAGPEPVEAQYFVESYQVAGQPLAQVRLSKTAPMNTTYDFDALAVRGASVQIHLMQPGGGPEQTFRLAEQPDRPGVYAPAPGHTVLPERTYRLEITAPGGERLSAQTTVPGAFALARVRADTVVYRGEQFEVHITKSRSPGRDAIFVFSNMALDPDPDNMVPFVADLYKDGDLSIDDVRMVATTPLNQANYDENPDQTLRIEMPWLMVYFYGPQRVTMNAIDDNMFDFMRSYVVQQGGSTLSPGEVPNLIDHVEGGTGVFASYASVTHELYVRRDR